MGCSRPGAFENIRDEEQKYDVRILRDTWGVPHIFGVTDPDVAYGLAYAHAEDDFATIQDALLAARGTLASSHGPNAAASDYMVHLFRVWDVVDSKYETNLSPDMRAVCEAYADGLNYYASLHPDEVIRGLFPVRGKDVIAGFVFKLPFFYNTDLVLKELMGPERKREISPHPGARASRLAFPTEWGTGSNAFAVGPSRSADGKTRLCSNSHQPWDGPVAWYEVHLRSEEGWNITGGTFPGSPVVFNGHNRHLSWTSTNNYPDLIDVYVLDINPDNPNQYRFDGEWRDLEVRTAPIKVKLFGPISWTFKQEALWSVYGPVLRRPHGTYAIRYAGIGEIRMVEQWYRMDKARNFDEWLDAMRMMSLPMFNYTYADEEGAIYYLYNALMPLRADGFDWTQYLPGDTSETLWTEYLPFDKLPQITNPTSGFLQNCNNTPYHTTTGSDNPKPEDYSSTLGIEMRMTNRAVRALELFGADESITEEEFHAYKYDLGYSKNSWAGDLIRQILDAPPSDDPVVQEAIEVLRKWDLRTNIENPNAAVGALTIYPFYRTSFRDREGPDLMETFAGIAHKLKDAHGRIDVPWGEVNRLRRGDVDLPLSGGPDVLRAISGPEIVDGRVAAKKGDSYVLFVTWDENGVTARSINPYGTAVQDESSPHYADQSPLFAGLETKPVWFDEADIRANLEREYRPGDEIGR
jgi:penicillin amidase/acyl-homoserine-lactone acylase